MGGVIFIKADYKNLHENFLLHSYRVAKMSEAMGKVLGLNENKLRDLTCGALVHDIGKLYISEDILNKPARLTNDEYSEVKDHTVLGCYSDLADCLDNSKIREIIKFHHERYNGTGYPSGLKGDDIPFYAQIVAVADSFDAMVDSRGYNKPKTLKEALNEIVDCAGTLYNSEVVKAFVKVFNEVTEYYTYPNEELEDIKKYAKKKL